MTANEIQTILAAQFPDCEIHVEGEGRNFNLMIIGSAFEGLRTLKRQQLVYGALNEHIADGSIHAINMKTFTPEEWTSR